MGTRIHIENNLNRRVQSRLVGTPFVFSGTGDLLVGHSRERACRFKIALQNNVSYGDLAEFYLVGGGYL